MKKTSILTLLLLVATVFCTTAMAGNDGQQPVKKQKVQTFKGDVQLAKMDYHETAGLLNPHRMQRAAANGLTAAFSVQSDEAQAPVWSENFDGGNALAKWTLDYGTGNEITIELGNPSSKDFSTIDGNNVNSLKMEGGYRTAYRTKGYATYNEAVTVPDNGRLHGYVSMSSNLSTYATLVLQVSVDDFANTTDVWSSADVKTTGREWVEIDGDLSAFVGKKIKLRLYYGPGVGDWTGGYMADFYVDGLSVTGVVPVESIQVKAGDEIQFVDLSTATATSWQWSFPGGTPSTSTEQNPVVYYKKGGSYDVTLTVGDGSETDALTKEGFVEVEGVLPVAGVDFPCDFRDLTTRNRMVAPFAPLHYADASTGFPTSSTWTFVHDSEVTGGIIQPKVYDGDEVDYVHEKTGKYYVTHIAQNEEGYDFVDVEEESKFAGMVTNFLPTDGYQTNVVDGDLTLPGANKMGITAWAEKFSKPSVPSLLTAMYVNFTKASASELTDQIASVSFYLCKSENGLPGERIDLLDSWMMSELNYAMTTNDGVVTLELNGEYVVDDEFFVVIEGIPEKNDNLECAIAMAPLRSEGNTAYMLNKGTWRPFTGYFQTAPGGQTSLAVFPVFVSSVVSACEVAEGGVVTPAEAVVRLPKTAGTYEQQLFAYLGVTAFGEPADGWLRVTNTPVTNMEEKETVEPIRFEFDALPEGMKSRETTVDVGDGVTTLTLHIVQGDEIPDVPTVLSSVSAVPTAQPEYFDMQGRSLSGRSLPKGLVIEKVGQRSVKRVVR